MPSRASLASCFANGELGKLWRGRLTLCRVLLANVEHGIVEGAAHEELEGEVVDALRVGKGLALLRLVPVDDKLVAEGQAGGRVGGRLVAIEHRASQRRLHVPDHRLLKVIRVTEARHLVLQPGRPLALGNRGCSESHANQRCGYGCLAGSPASAQQERANRLKESQFIQASDKKLTFNTPDFSSSKTGEGAPMLGPGDSCRPNRALDVHDGRAHRGATLPRWHALLRGTSAGSHFVAAGPGQLRNLKLGAELRQWNEAIRELSRVEVSLYELLLRRLNEMLGINEAATAHFETGGSISTKRAPTRSNKQLAACEQGRATLKAGSYLREGGVGASGELNTTGGDKKYPAIQGERADESEAKDHRAGSFKEPESSSSRADIGDG